MGGQGKSLFQKQCRRYLVVDDDGDEGKEGKEIYAAQSRKRLSQDTFKFLSITQRYAIPDSLPLESNYGTGALALSPSSMLPSGVWRLASGVRKVAASLSALARENNSLKASPSLSS